MVQTLGVIAVPVPTTPVNAVAVSIAAGTHSDPGVVAGQPIMAQRVTIQSFTGVGIIFIGNKAVINLTTGDGMLHRLLTAGDEKVFEQVGGMPGASGLIDLRQFWIDAVEIADSVLISYEVAGKIRQA